MGEEARQYKIERLHFKNIPTVMAHETELFHSEWKATTWEEEINNNISDYFMLTVADELIGYAGYWLVAGEAQVVRVAVATPYQGCGWGKRIMQALIERAREEGAFLVSLEVRASNIRAQRLYTSVGLKVVGTRPGYYKNPEEDAIIMQLGLKTTEE